MPATDLCQEVMTSRLDTRLPPLWPPRSPQDRSPGPPPFTSTGRWCQEARMMVPMTPLQEVSCL